jgi:hypothetical protein
LLLTDSILQAIAQSATSEAAGWISTGIIS